MTYAEEIRRQVEAAPRVALPAVTSALWRAYGEGQVTEAEAESLSVLIEERRLTYVGSTRPKLEQASNLAGTAVTEVKAGRAVGAPRRTVGSRPRTDASMERRRRWAASGRHPRAIAARFTLAEQGVLSLVAAEGARRKDCPLAVGDLAAIVGVVETTVRNEIREAVKLGIVHVEERRVNGCRNDRHMWRIVAAGWPAWPRPTREGG
ncbi:helix-turn-helix domain-containing protein, partial [Methylobacterium sp. E-065]|uniref:helix-turn-helix domain-containing protein n=1 Tax=Methylobacterium sp. E-065 TaxID=2836583 RepID=UPI001FB9E319|nr:helix-turn-helix domain-containing protein [Methylobacterium sp. E-065]